MLLGSTLSFAGDEDRPQGSAGARQVAVTGASLSGVGAVLLGTSALLALSANTGDGCVDWCGNLGLTLATGGLGTVLLVPGAVITLAGATRMNAIDRHAGGRQSALPVGVGWGLAGLGAVSFGAAALVDSHPQGEFSRPGPFIYAGLGLFAGSAVAGGVQIGLGGRGSAVSVSPAPNGVVVGGTF